MKRKSLLQTGGGIFHLYLSHDLISRGNISFDEKELNVDFIRSSGPGGQNINKVSTAVQLRFNIVAIALVARRCKKTTCPNWQATDYLKTVKLSLKQNDSELNQESRGCHSAVDCPDHDKLHKNPKSARKLNHPFLHRLHEYSTRKNEERSRKSGITIPKIGNNYSPESESMQKHSAYGLISGLSAAAIWGGMYVVSKVVMETISPFHAHHLTAAARNRRSLYCDPLARWNKNIATDPSGRYFGWVQ